jgi:predicted nucleic acid-binding protein
LTARYLVDKSALARFPLKPVGDRLRPLLEDGLVATCAIVDLEVLYSARSAADYEATRKERRSLPDAPITPEVLNTALDTQHQLATRGQHRLPIPDLIIAAAAEAAQLSVLHYDADFERIAAITGQAQEWVVPRGSI